jgi:hypothetical protein
MDAVIKAARYATNTCINDYKGLEPVASLCFSSSYAKLVLGLEVAEAYLELKHNSLELPFAGFHALTKFEPRKRHDPSHYRPAFFINLVMRIR